MYLIRHRVVLFPLAFFFPDALSLAITNQRMCPEVVFCTADLCFNCMITVLVLSEVAFVAFTHLFHISNWCKIPVRYQQCTGLSG